MKEVAVIGAGPAGLTAAIAASEAGARVDLYDHNEKIGKKLYITGKGRCNLTNDIPIEDFLDHVTRNRKFLYSALYTFTNEMLIEMVEGAGCKLKHERGGRVFPVSDKSSDVIKAFKKLLERADVNLYTDYHIDNLYVEDGICKGIYTGGKKKEYDAVILASGGVSYQATGSDGSGHKIARALGHTIVPTEPGLVALRTKEKWPGDISGLSLKNVGVELKKGEKTIYSERGECLFTHRGLSGPVILTASSFISPPYKDYRIIINLKPALDEKKLDERILRDFDENKNRDFKNSLQKLLPKNLIPVIVDLSKISADKKVNTITKEERTRLLKLLKGLTLTIEGPEEMRTAIITRGGVDVSEIDASTMESKLIPGLYFAGEIIDVDALTGGFNIQIAASTGYLAGISCAG